MSSSASAPPSNPPTVPADSPLIASVVPLVPAWRVDRTFDYVVPPELADQLQIGSLVRTRFGGRNVRAVVAGLEHAEPDRELEQIGGIVLGDPVAPPPLNDLIRWMARRYVVPAGKAFARVVPPRVRVKVDEPVPLPVEPAPSLIPTYTGGTDLLAAIAGGSSGVWCVECLPGHDRSALIAELVAAAGRTSGGTALVAVPEVRYGSQVLDGLVGIFGEVARVDSAQTDGMRSKSMMRLGRGHGLGAGGRAVVLAPAKNLRLLVMDEEHHRSYKEDRAPRYDARRVAIERAALSKAVCVLMSSTPSVETGAAAARGDIGWVTPDRATRRAARPVVEFMEKDEARAVSHELHVRMRDVLAAGGRVALLAPARGYSRTIWCATCARSLRCPRCEAGLSLDGPPGGRTTDVRCRRCGLVAEGLHTCPNCGGTDFRWIGSGSQRLAEQLTRSFPRARVAYMDPSNVEDSAAEARDADIYVTTWIGTKAVFRPTVSLVGILDADALIRRPHFRATEQAYQAFAEMSDWVGPAADGGRLVIQGSEPGHYVIQAVTRGDYRFFLERELALREELNYPPFSELVRITSRVADPGVLERAAQASRAAGGTVLGPIAVYQGPTGRDAQQILVKCSDALLIADALRSLARDTPSGSGLAIDVDPR
ncbi:MAG TPA: primosomal protein N' [Actinomycetota bacterium]|nr:primosomal protein N' [Actinomycetota bacterium]